MLWRAELGQEGGLGIDAREQLMRVALEKELGPADRAYARGFVSATSTEAIREYQCALRLDKFHQRARNRLSFLLFTLGRYDEVRELFLTYKLIFPNDPMPTALYALTLASQGKMDEANEVLGSIRARVGESFYARWQVLFQFLAKYHHFAESDLLEQGNTIGTQQSFNASSFIAEVRGVLNSARTGDKTALDYPIHVTRVFHRLLWASPPLMWGNPAPMIHELEKSGLVYPMGILAYFRGGLLLAEENYREADKALMTATELPSIINVQRAARYHALVAEHRFLGKEGTKLTPELRERILVNVKALLASDRTSPSLLGYLLKVSLDCGDMDLARSIVGRWEHLDPHSPQPRIARGNCELIAGAFARAVQEAENLLRLHPGYEPASQLRERGLRFLDEQSRLYNSAEARAGSPESAHFFYTLAHDFAKRAVGHANYELRQSYVSLTMTALKRAVNTGSSNAAAIAAEPAFKVLQFRPDFRELLLSVMDAAFPVQPFATEG
jgi:tetratricopeptide (TPR) repeat protein